MIRNAVFSFPSSKVIEKELSNTVKKSNTWVEPTATKIKIKSFPYLRHSCSLHMCFSTCLFSSNLSTHDTLAAVLSYGFLSCLNYSVVCFKPFRRDTQLHSWSTKSTDYMSCNRIFSFLQMETGEKPKLHIHQILTRVIFCNVNSRAMEVKCSVLNSWLMW